MLCVVIYTDKFIRARLSGLVIAFIILIRPSCRDNEGLLEHERVHVWQFWRTFGLHALFYLFSKSYRLEAELEAYKTQLTYEPAKSNPTAYAWTFARFLAEEYGLSISQHDAYSRLLN